MILEMSVAVGGILLLVTLALGMTAAQKQRLRHDTVDTPQEAQPQLPMDEIFKDKIIFFRTKSVEKNTQELQEKGWTEKNKYNVQGTVFVQFEKDGHHLLLTGNTGVITWPKN